MSFVGKILVVVQLVLSVLFMALAGAVFSVHQNWKTKYDAQVTIVEGLKKDVATAQSDLSSVRQESQKIVDDNKAQLGTLTEQVGNQVTELTALKKKNNEDQQELQTQSAIAMTKAKEAEFRIQESEEQRASNRALQAALDLSATEKRQLEDEKFGLQVEFDNLKDQYNNGLVQLAYLEKIVRTKGINTDPKVAAKLAEPAPPVEGLVDEVKMDRTHRPKYLTISIGSDDGLLKGHILDVRRSGVGGKVPQYLGKVQIISILPDSAVCIVLEPTKNGIIEVGDNVTTNL